MSLLYRKEVFDEAVSATGHTISGSFEHCFKNFLHLQQLQDITAGCRGCFVNSAIIRQRIHWLREQRDLPQTELARALGFKDRQTISDIERGERKISAEELVSAASFFGVDIGFFTDPFELAGEACFSWRRDTVPNVTLEGYEQQAGRWLQMYRHLCRLRDRPVRSRNPRVDINERSSFEDAGAEGEAIWAQLDLGKVPAARLAGKLSEELDTLVLNVDTPEGVSGSACRIGALDAIIVNRQEASHRRAFDLAHELFHLLTWDQMEPRHIENHNVTDPGYRRIEKLADNFAAGLLMPWAMVKLLVEAAPVPDESDFPDWIKGLAVRLGVSGQAVKWRLVSLGVVTQAAAERIDDEAIRIPNNRDENTVPRRFSGRFVEVVQWGIEQGHISARQAATMLGVTLDDLIDLFDEHDLAAPFDL